jgi:hypothetical protein
LLALAIGLGVFGIAAGSLDAGLVGEGRLHQGYDKDDDSDDDSSDDRDGGSHDTGSYNVKAVDGLYQEECGSCHLAYPPHLLPSASWKAIMNGLDDHFGDNAELTVDMNRQITTFLDVNASDRGDRMTNARLLHGVVGDPPLRITELHYFKKEHNEIPRRMIEDNPKVQSLSRCDACHQDAARGRFDEDEILIPGIGAWDD